jgi:two-component system, OmpR family, response regulator
MITILCIDEYPTALHVRKRVLESAGYSVLAAGDAVTAMHLFTSMDVGIVLTDHFLEGTTGMELAAEMKRLKPHIPIVILSGAVDPPDGLLHADLFLCKAETTITILQKISELVNR